MTVPQRGPDPRNTYDARRPGETIMDAVGRIAAERRTTPAPAVTPPVPEAEAPGPSAFPAPADLCAAWRRHVPDVTDDEVMALVPLVQNRRPGWLHLVVAAYRRGARNGGVVSMQSPGRTVDVADDGATRIRWTDDDDRVVLVHLTDAEANALIDDLGGEVPE